MSSVSLVPRPSACSPLTRPPPAPPPPPSRPRTSTPTSRWTSRYVSFWPPCGTSQSFCHCSAFETFPGVINRLFRCCRSASCWCRSGSRSEFPFWWRSGSGSRSYPSFINVRKLGIIFLTLIHSIARLHCFFFLIIVIGVSTSSIFDSILKFSGIKYRYRVVKLYIRLKWIRIRISQNDAGPATCKQISACMPFKITPVRTVNVNITIYYTKLVLTVPHHMSSQRRRYRYVSPPF